MAKICPVTKEKVLYLDCLECDEKGICKKEKRRERNEEIINNINCSSPDAAYDGSGIC